MCASEKEAFLHCPMACCGCCLPSKDTRKNWAFASAALGAATGAAVVWLWSASDAAHEEIECVVDKFEQIDGLSKSSPTCTAECEAHGSCTCIDFSSAESLVDAVPAAGVAVVKGLAAGWDALLLAPGGAAVGLSLFAGGLGCANRFRRCLKLANTVSLGAALWATMLVFLLCGVAAFLSTSGEVLSAFATHVQKPCAAEIESAQELVLETQANFADMGCDVVLPGYEGLCLSANLSVAHATALTAQVEALCECAEDVPDALALLRFPATVGLGFALALLVAQYSLCASVGCCMKPQIGAEAGAASKENVAATFVFYDTSKNPLLGLRV